MKAQILGIGQRRSGKSKSSGKPYDLTSIYCAHPARDVEGEIAEEIVFNHLAGIDFPNIHVGDTLFFSYDRRGYLEEIDIVDKTGKTPQGGSMKINSI